MSVVIETTLGTLTVDLYTSTRPRACLNFLKLCKIKYYNFNLFHTISRGFIAQTGDPTGSRSGGESIYGVIDGPQKRYFEYENEPRIKHTKMGLISFVGNEEHMIGSQFFITLGDDLIYLDEQHCVFGEVVEGFDVLEVINEVICDTDDRPYQDVRITHTVVLDDPFPDPKNFKVPSRSPSPSAERLQGGRIAPDEDVDETEGRTAQEISEMQAEREAKARATILEMVGDIPDADMAPPENVLFVCKLNPVTTDDDLEVIFNRFGKIKSCEVIRDRKTGDSLQYAFIEFEDQKSCEDAYFKMDNILIDDRRIHVDFSQSVSKIRWMGKGRGVKHYDEKGKLSNTEDKNIGMGNYKQRNNNKNDRYNRSSDNRDNEYYNSSRTDRNNEDRHRRSRSRANRNENSERHNTARKENDNRSRLYKGESHEDRERNVYSSKRHSSNRNKERHKSKSRSLSRDRNRTRRYEEKSLSYDRYYTKYEEYRGNRKEAPHSEKNSKYQSDKTSAEPSYKNKSSNSSKMYSDTRLEKRRKNRHKSSSSYSDSDSDGSKNVQKIKKRKKDKDTSSKKSKSKYRDTSTSSSNDSEDENEIPGSSKLKKAKSSMSYNGKKRKGINNDSRDSNKHKKKKKSKSSSPSSSESDEPRHKKEKNSKSRKTYSDNSESECKLKQNKKVKRKKKSRYSSDSE